VYVIFNACVFTVAANAFFLTLDAGAGAAMFAISLKEIQLITYVPS
jgi:hypothetical protein